MNFRFVFYQLGNILKLEAVLMLLPLFVSIYYKEQTYLAFLIPIGLLLALGTLLTFRKDMDKTIYAKEGFVIVGLSWILMSLFGMLPFIISKEIPNIVNAFFETASGFTTTGASILNDIESLSKGMLFWRSFTHWIGGMGILVFVLAFLPQTSSRSMFIIKAESPGPKMSKLVSRVRHTARLLYLIYIGLTVLLIIFLLFKMPFYDSVVHAVATAGTGGFSIKNTSIAFYNSAYIEVVITIFMILFGVNFSIFYLLLIGSARKALKSEELRWYIIFLVVSISIITVNTISLYDHFGETLRHASFQVASIMTTTGFSSFDFNNWPTLSKYILLLLMLIGASAGSTGGGIKVSRVVIFIKMIFREIRYAIHPRQVTAITFENKAMDDGVLKGLGSYLFAYIFIFTIATFIISLEGKDLITTFTAVLSCLNNIGPGLEIVGPTGNFAGFTNLSKITLVFTMLAGRLEIFPMLILFSPGLWKKVN